uniref:Small ribosomal subunit protein mS23 n=1 Tax=Arion vulgaris TaxID=1028688 RepID=A0A0B7BUG6_9EUPU
MAGSRREKLGSVFTRLTGLLRSGALKEEDRPIWYDVVKAFPPKPIPSVEHVPNILYPEDFIRVHYYKTFHEPVLTVLSNEKIKSVPQRFVDKYLELQSQKTVPTEQIFDETINILKREHVKFVTLQEKEEKEKARRESMFTQPQRESIFEHQQRDEIFVDHQSTPLEESMSDDSSHQPPSVKKPQVTVKLDDLFEKN